MTNQASAYRLRAVSRKLLSVVVLIASVPLLTRALSQPNPTRNFMARFVDALPIPPRIQVKASDPQDLDIQLTAVSARIHRDLPETAMWGYNQSSPGPTIEVESGKLLRV